MPSYFFVSQQKVCAWLFSIELIITQYCAIVNTNLCLCGIKTLRCKYEEKIHISKSERLKRR